MVDIERLDFEKAKANKKIKLFWVIGIIIFLLGIASVALIFLNQEKETFLSPFIEGELWPFAKSKEMEVIGFMPYWNLKDDYDIDFKAFDTLIYFNLLVDNDGTILRKNGLETEPGWRNFKSEKVENFLKLAKSKRKKIGISIAAFDEEVLLGVTSDKGKQKILIEEIINLINQYNFDHINIDFEYFPEKENKEFGQNFNIFLDSLRKAIKLKNERIVLSIDIYPKAVIKGTPYKIKEMSALADKIILMAYDFHNILSDNAGPIAPLKTDNEKEYSIFKTFNTSINSIMPGKYILGIPLYGYEWLTKDNKPGSETIAKTGQTASYKRVKQLIADQGLEVNWDATASSPWINFEDEDGDNHQIYFENLESIKLKIQLALQLKLGGVAFWALGYEGQNQEIWQYVKKVL